MSNLLNEAVDDFIAGISPALRALGNDNAVEDVTVEALDLVTAFIDVDDRRTDDELWAIITDFGPRLKGALSQATPAVLRSGFVEGRKRFLDQPSNLFNLLAETDRAKQTTHATNYIKSAAAIAHAVCALDLTPSETELIAVERFRSMLTNRLKEKSVPTTPPAPVESVESLLDELNALIGLEAVKREVKLLADLLQVEKLRKKHGLPVVEHSRHLVFVGNPGTGKTTVARLLARVYRALGVGDKGHLVETDRANLVAGYIGQTAPKVHAVVESALGGVLLIDEAYTLARGGENDFGLEAIDTLVKLIEDKREEFVVIVAGYPDEMNEFIESNPGLQSRFPKTLLFDDYSTDELMQIFESLCTKNSYICDDSAKQAVKAFFDGRPRDKGFGNGRLARNLFESSISHQASRVVQISDPTAEQLQLLTASDIS